MSLLRLQLTDSWFVQDIEIERSVTHNVKIIKMYTNGFSTKDIARSIMSHTPTSVDRYIRVAIITPHEFKNTDK